MPFLTIDGSKIEFEQFPEATPRMPTIVFLHEGLGCVEMWKDFPRQLTEVTGCGGVVFSRLGYGKSDPNSSERAPTFMNDEALITLPKMLRQLDAAEIILLGHSDGGSIALIYAAHARDPNLLGLILEAPHVFVEEISIQSIESAALKFKTGSLRVGLERYHGKNVDAAFWSWNHGWLDPDFRSWNIEECLPNIDIPVLAIQGSDDEYGTLAQVEAIKEGCATTVTAVFDNCAHTPHRDQPQLTLDTMASFISTLTLSPR